MNECPKCGKETYREHPFCIECEIKFLAAGICKWCGIMPRKPRYLKCKQSDYCEKCQSSCKIAVTTEYIPKYRGRDAKENIKETKFGE